ncbi:MAG: hypothetical protein Q4C85_08750 [Actinomyces sp.]|uniref:hypothetical protein n=1 Tax=Actinomyces sp. TaxID=29317 RepID=UPI0026DD4917|nr:hypothetical protein [Actinomyces sp.]MDO4243827.1 hypothetical protein [Actinomyces sp.]
MSAESLLVGVLVALAVAVLLMPARRPGPQPRGPDRPPERRPGPREPVDIGLLLIEVATLLRAGATPQRAWSRALGRAGIHEGAEPGEDGVPPALRALGVPAGPWWTRPPAGRVGVPGHRAGRRRRAELQRAARAAVPGAVAACRLTAALGAPLAGVLEEVAGGVAESGRAESSRRVALAGPCATARLLAALPLAGLGLGALVGARPHEVPLDGGRGSTLGVLGLVLVAVGHVLTRRLVAAAVAQAAVVDEALVIDLASAALEAGASLPGTLQALGSALGDDDLVVVGRALLLGASWDEAWRAADPGEQEVAAVSRPRRGDRSAAAPRGRTRSGTARGAAPGRSRPARRVGGPLRGPVPPPCRERWSRLEGCLRPGWEDGASPGPLLAGTAAALRASRRAQDEEAAERLAVRLVLPLGACSLPAFIILGIVPVVLSVGADMLAR